MDPTAAAFFAAAQDLPFAFIHDEEFNIVLHPPAPPASAPPGPAPAPAPAPAPVPPPALPAPPAIPAIPADAAAINPFVDDENDEDDGQQPDIPNDGHVQLPAQLPAQPAIPAAAPALPHVIVGVPAGTQTQISVMTAPAPVPGPAPVLAARPRAPRRPRQARPRARSAFHLSISAAAIGFIGGLVSFFFLRHMMLGNSELTQGAGAPPDHAHSTSIWCRIFDVGCTNGAPVSDIIAQSPAHDFPGDVRRILRESDGASAGAVAALSVHAAGVKGGHEAGPGETLAQCIQDLTRMRTQVAAVTRLDLMIPRIVEYHHILKNPSELGAALDRLAKANLQLLLGANAGRLYGVMGADAILQGFTRGHLAEGQVDPDALGKDFRFSLSLAEEQMANASKYILQSSEHVMDAKEYTRLALKLAIAEIQKLRASLDEAQTGFSYIAYGWVHPFLSRWQPGLQGKNDEIRGAAIYLKDLVHLLESGVYNTFALSQCTTQAQTFLAEVGQWQLFEQTINWGLLRSRLDNLLAEESGLWGDKGSAAGKVVELQGIVDPSRAVGQLAGEDSSTPSTGVGAPSQEDGDRNRAH